MSSYTQDLTESSSTYVCSKLCPSLLALLPHLHKLNLELTFDRFANSVPGKTVSPDIYHGWDAVLGKRACHKRDQLGLRDLPVESRLGHDGGTATECIRFSRRREDYLLTPRARLAWGRGWGRQRHREGASRDTARSRRSRRPARNEISSLPRVMQGLSVQYSLHRE